MAGAPRREVVVIDAAGRPVSGAIVEVALGTAPTPEVGHVTDAQGQLRLTLPPGRFTLRAVTHDGSRGEVEVAGGEGGTIEIKVRSQ